LGREHFGNDIISPLFNFLPDWLIFRETARLVFEPTAANSLPPESLANVCVVRWWADRWYYVDTERKGRQITAKVRSLGAFALKRDDKAPWANFVSASRDAIVFEVRDDFSGFGLGNLPTAYVDNDWTLAEYDPEAATIAIKGKKRFSTGKHFVKIVLEDRAKNKFEKTYEITLK
jgi:hypothetical protein